MSSHTPGPWRFDDFARGEVRTVGARYHVAGGNEMKVADVRGWGYLTGGGSARLAESVAADIQRANGALIAAAPELLEALEMLLDKWERYGPGTTTVSGRPTAAQIASAAIVKARGG